MDNKLNELIDWMEGKLFIAKSADLNGLFFIIIQFIDKAKSMQSQPSERMYSEEERQFDLGDLKTAFEHGRHDTISFEELISQEFKNLEPKEDKPTEEVKQEINNL